MSTSLTVRAAEQEMLILPATGVRPGSLPIVMCHGAGGAATSFNLTTLPWQFKFGQALEAAGLSISHANLGGTVAPNLGTATWGNDTVVDRIESARLNLVALGCRSDKVGLVGTSMGGISCWSYARANPTKVAAIVAMIPVCDIEDMRPIGGFGVQIEAAWGIAAGGVLPDRANPNTVANAALIASSGASISLYYSTADTTTRPGPVTQLAAKLGVTPTLFSTTLNHSDAQFEFIPVDTIIAQLKAAGA